MISIICAMGSNRAIGRANQLPWRLPGDLKRFKSLTMGHPIIMGRKTFESIGRPLPGRTNIVITSNADFRADGCLSATSFDAAIALARRSPGQEEVFVIGGAQIYATALSMADKLYLTLVDDCPADADAFFPEYDGFETLREEAPVEENGLIYRFADLVRATGTRVHGHHA